MDTFHIKEIQYLNSDNQNAVFAITECGQVFKKRTTGIEESNALGKLLMCRTFANVPFIPNVVKIDAIYEQLDNWVNVTNEYND
tara:strand:+ start:231 stop:482 length:252 start_codon:yes stop_codon:yes gene_type:complete